MITKIRLVDGRVYQLGGVEAERVNKQLDSENELIEINFEGTKTRIYKRYIISVEWRRME